VFYTNWSSIDFYLWLNEIRKEESWISEPKSSWDIDTSLLLKIFKNVKRENSQFRLLMERINTSSFLFVCRFESPKIISMNFRIWLSDLRLAVFIHYSLFIFDFYLSHHWVVFLILALRFTLLIARCLLQRCS